MQFEGRLFMREVSPDGYNDLRTLHDPAFDVHPRLIALCTNAGDVGISIMIAKATGLAVVCRSGGHSTAGNSGRNDAMVIGVRKVQHCVIDTH